MKIDTLLGSLVLPINFGAFALLLILKLTHAFDSCDLSVTNFLPPLLMFSGFLTFAYLVFLHLLENTQTLYPATIKLVRGIVWFILLLIVYLTSQFLTQIDLTNNCDFQVHDASKFVKILNVFEFLDLICYTLGLILVIPETQVEEQDKV